ncbi:ribosome recycling factor [Candidatus Solincola tengchongensis]|uniref:ribosome recycling factor n=1 Tax=Candidatus Solincola tengchongensis TaxID=2900693 RepID=UPI003313068E
MFVDVEEGRQVVEDVLKDAERRMKKAVEHVRDDFAAIRTGRASASLLNRVYVNYYGQQTPLNQIASIAVPEPSLLVVSPYDKSVINEIEKAILASDLGLNPVNDGNVIRLPIPKLTEERRKELTRMVRARAEEGRVAIRNIRRDAIEDLRAFEKEGEITKDDLHRGQEEVQKLTDRYIAETDEMLKVKEKELMEV